MEVKELVDRCRDELRRLNWYDLLYLHATQKRMMEGNPVFTEWCQRSPYAARAIVVARCIAPGAKGDVVTDLAVRVLAAMDIAP